MDSIYKLNETLPSATPCSSTAKASSASSAESTPRNPLKTLALPLGLGSFRKMINVDVEARTSLGTRVRIAICR
jgi:hypothetical protein